jgi:hypothetical protein
MMNHSEAKPFFLCPVKIERHGSEMSRNDSERSQKLLLSLLILCAFCEPLPDRRVILTM